MANNPSEIRNSGKLWLLLYIFIGLINLAGNLLPLEILRTWSKPLLMPTLIGYFYLHTKHLPNSFVKWMMAGFVFSWGGDLALMKEAEGAEYFIIGLVSFLLAHLCYIKGFIKTPYRNRKSLLRSKPWIWLIFIILEASLLYLLFPYLKEMKIPVIIYATIIILMSIYALNRHGRVNDRSFNYIFIGALIFLVSDTTIALNKFYAPFNLAGFCIMCTYILSQLLIAKGSIEQINEKSASRIG